MMKKNLPTQIRIKKEKLKDRVNIIDKKIDEKPPNPVGTKEKNRS